MQLEIFVLTHFHDANRYPLRSKMTLAVYGKTRRFGFFCCSWDRYRADLYFHLALRIFRAVFAESGLCRNEPRNADQVIGDEIEDEIGADPKNAAMLGLAHCAIFLPQPKMHPIILRRVCDMP